MIEDSILLNCYTIDGKDYIVINEIDYKGVHYIYLSNENDEEDIMIRKLTGEVLEPLEDETELNEVLKLLIN